MAEDVMIWSAWDTLQAIHPTLPRRDHLMQEREDARAAQERGYYLPDEDERLRAVYTRYLEARTLLLEMIAELRTRWQDEDLRLFAIAYAAAAILMRSAGDLVEMARHRPVVRRKLDEAEPRFTLPRKTFTTIYRNYTSPVTLWQFSQARRYYERNRTTIHEALRSTGMGSLVDDLISEEPFAGRRKRVLWRSLLDYRLYSLGRRGHSGYVKVMFHLFRMSGSAIAGKHDPFRRRRSDGKRVTSEVLIRAAEILQPGDIIMTRHDDALSNHFFPGYWPHAALFLGSPGDRRDRGLPDHDTRGFEVLEAKKDGVKLRALAETLAVDAFVILRPAPQRTALAEVLTRALTHEGKLYDFLFDFTKSDRLACTEVIYRSFHGSGDWHLRLVRQSGRLTLPAEELMKQALGGGFASVAAIFGARGCAFLTGPEARGTLEKTLVLQ